VAYSEVRQDVGRRKRKDSENLSVREIIRTYRKDDDPKSQGEG
jgi:hypothetical protein